MSKIAQNLVVLLDPSDDTSNISLKAGNMILNRFCIDEDAAFELSGVNYLKKSSSKMVENEISRKFYSRRKEKGKEDLFLRSNNFERQFYFILRNLIFMEN